MKKPIFLLLPLFLLAADIKEIKYQGLIHISPISANTLIKITPNSEYDIKKIDEIICIL